MVKNHTTFGFSFHTRHMINFIVALTVLSSVQASPVGIFESATDVGAVTQSGSSHYDETTQTYRITGSGANIWGALDAFHFLSKKATGDLSLSMDVTWVGEGLEPHRKACLMVRQSLEPDAPYVDIAVHGDGLIELQYRLEKGGQTLAARTPIQSPARVRLERDGDVFTAFVCEDGGPFQTIGAIELSMPHPVHVGLAVSSHNHANKETALISKVEMHAWSAAEDEERVRESSLETLDIATGKRELVYRDHTLFEAPNWAPDGKLFYLNREGLIFTLPVEGGELKHLDTGDVRKNNNDHGLSFDGRWLAISSGSGEFGSKIYVLPATGGEPRLITPIGPSYWHGWSPDGKKLLYCAMRDDDYDVYSIPSEGGAETRLTTAPGLDDGCEYTADGSKIYFHSARNGAPKIWRMNPDGSEQEQVTFDDDYADWFPHPSPDGKWILFLSYDSSVDGHPYDKNVVLRLMPLKGGKPIVLATLFGGQGTINVPSWSPDGRKVAFVSYRHILPRSKPQFTE